MKIFEMNGFLNISKELTIDRISFIFFILYHFITPSVENGDHDVCYEIARCRLLLFKGNHFSKRVT